MKIKILVVIAILVTLLSAVACAGVNAQEGGQITQQIDIRNSEEFEQNQHIQKQVDITKGDTLLVTLISNATTGFVWDENAAITDTAIIEQTKHENIAANSDKVGAPGEEQWTFKALKAGTTAVHLEYSRPWEGGEKGVWVFDLTVTVK